MSPPPGPEEDPDPPPHLPEGSGPTRGCSNPPKVQNFHSGIVPNSFLHFVKLFKSAQVHFWPIFGGNFSARLFVGSVTRTAPLLRWGCPSHSWTGGGGVICNFPAIFRHVAKFSPQPQFCRMNLK